MIIIQVRSEITLLFNESCSFTYHHLTNQLYLLVYCFWRSSLTHGFRFDGIIIITNNIKHFSKWAENTLLRYSCTDQIINKLSQYSHTKLFIINEFPQKCALHSVESHQIKSRVQRITIERRQQEQERQPVVTRHRHQLTITIIIPQHRQPHENFTPKTTSFFPER